MAPRLRRRSSAILTSNAAAVVKAVLLLRRTGGEFPQPKHSGPRMTPDKNSPTLPFARLPYVKGTSDVFPRSKKTNTVSGCLTRQKSAPVTTDKSKFPLNEENPRCRSVGALDQAAKSTSDSPQAQHKRSTFSKQSNRKLLPKSEQSASSQKKVKTRKINDRDVKRKNLEKKNGKNAKVVLTKKEQKEANIPDVLPAISLPHGTQTSKAPTERLEKRNIIIKEVINTGYPGQNGPPSSYRRFPPSMFHVLDELKSEQSKQTHAQFSPWVVGMAAKKWKNTLKRQVFFCC